MQSQAHGSHGKRLTSSSLFSRRLFDNVVMRGGLTDHDCGEGSPLNQLWVRTSSLRAGRNVASSALFGWVKSYHPFDLGVDFPTNQKRESGNVQPHEENHHGPQ